MTLDDLKRLIEPVHRRVTNLISRAVVQRTDDSKGVQELQLELLDSEVRDEVERVGEYGFTSVPLEGAEAVTAFAGGRRDHGLVIGVEDRRYRIKNLSGGEVAVYNHTGAKIVMKANGNIEATPGPDGKFKVNGDVEATGDVVAGAGGVAVSLQTHAHSVSGTAPSGGGPVVFDPVDETGGPA